MCDPVMNVLMLGLSPLLGYFAHNKLIEPAWPLESSRAIQFIFKCLPDISSDAYPSGT